MKVMQTDKERKGDKHKKGRDGRTRKGPKEEPKTNTKTETQGPEVERVKKRVNSQNKQK